MYQSSLKMDGGIIGLVSDDSHDVNISDAFETTQANESLMFMDYNEDGDPVEEVATAKLDPHTGDIAWIKSDCKDEIKKKTVSMSQMASMLKDLDRNNIYEQALKVCIQHFINIEKRPPTVLDVGTGTGLLAMMSAKAGASQVIGCEMFETMASIAEHVVHDNGYQETIHIIPNKSVDITIDDENQLADILVSELLDSSLLGESCIYSHSDAIKRLMKPPPHSSITSSTTTTAPTTHIPIEDRVIPHSGEIICHLIESSFIRDSTIVETMSISNTTHIWRDGINRNNCQGGQRIFPVHWSKLQTTGAKIVTPEIKVLDCSFYHILDQSSKDRKEPYYENDGDIDIVHESPDSRLQDNMILISDNNNHHSTSHSDNISTHNSDIHNDNSSDNCSDIDDPNIHYNDAYITIEHDCTIDGILFYWNLFLLSPTLDPTRQYTYSTRSGSNNWQDHWLQCVYPLAVPIQCHRGEILHIYAAHNNITLWFDVCKENSHNIPSFLTTCTPAVISSLSTTSSTLLPSHSYPGHSTTESLHQEGEVGGGGGGGGYSPKRSRSSPPSIDIIKKKHINKQKKNHIINQMSNIPQCICGWHLLYGAERIQMLNDSYRKQQYKLAIDNMIDNICHSIDTLKSRNNCTSIDADMNIHEDNKVLLSNDISNNIYIIIDLSEGSILSLYAASLLRDKQRNDIRIISKETKLFSRLIHAQVCESNNLEDVMIIWDGESSLEQLVDSNTQDWDSKEDDDIDEEGRKHNKKDYDYNYDDDDDNLMKNSEEFKVTSVENLEDMQTPMMYGEHTYLSSDINIEPTQPTTCISEEKKKNMILVGVIDDLFYFQLSTLPTWQALKHLYTYHSLSSYFTSSLNPAEKMMTSSPEEVSSASVSSSLQPIDTNIDVLNVHVLNSTTCISSEILSSTQNTLSTELLPVYSEPIVSPPLKPICIPKKIHIMIAAIESFEFEKCHGSVPLVNGFDHSYFNHIQEDWYTHYFPYKLGYYTKRFLTRPQCIHTLSSDTFHDQYMVEEMIEIPFREMGVCHGIAIWIDMTLWERSTCTSADRSTSSSESVDNSDGNITLCACRNISKTTESYTLSDNNSIHNPIESSHNATATTTTTADSLQQYDFPLHHTCNMKFFPIPISVNTDSILMSHLAFQYGDSDFTFNFNIDV